MNREPLSLVVHRHLVELIHTRRVSMNSVAIQVRESWDRRYPDDHSIEWSEDRDAHRRAELDAQRLARMLPGGPTRMDINLLVCFRDVFPAEIRAKFDAEVSAQLGVLFAPEVRGAPGPLLAGALMREAGEAINAVARLVADGHITPDEAPEVRAAILELEQLAGTVSSSISALKNAPQIGVQH
jgi:hypothetical protein